MALRSFSLDLINRNLLFGVDFDATLPREAVALDIRTLKGNLAWGIVTN